MVKQKVKKKAAAKSKAKVKRPAAVGKKRRVKPRSFGMVERKDRVIANTAKKDIWRRQGTSRIKGGALDKTDEYLKQYLKSLVEKAARSALDGRRRTIKSKDVDFALATEGTAVY